MPDCPQPTPYAFLALWWPAGDIRDDGRRWLTFSAGSLMLLVCRIHQVIDAWLPGAPCRVGLLGPQPGASAAGRGGAQRIGC
jgi:hypothetical protein